MEPTKRWKVAELSPQAVDLAQRLRTSPLLAQMLINRGVSDPDQCRAFLSPSLSDLHEPEMLANLPRAAQRIAQAIRDGRRIVIYGDYDVDGITATAILWHTIRLLGGQVQYYIPHRLEEGYGLNAEALRQICQDGAELVVTVDCGITAIEEARIAADAGVDLILTDHHEWRHAPQDPQSPMLPRCHTIVHPRLPAEGRAAYPNPHLCGAGVAFKLAWGIGKAAAGGGRVGEPIRRFLVEATALAALGTIADVVPLLGENRILAHFGLSGLAHSSLTGIRALIASANLSGEKLNSYHVGFLLAPRLNAAGRMGHARLAVEMLTDADATKASQIAQYLETQNRLRQTTERKILQEAIDQCLALGFDRDDRKAIVLGAQGWHAGVIGIVASRIVSRFNRPTIMVALEAGHGQGSGRSIRGFHLARALDACRQHLQTCGGHEMAAGLSLDAARFEAFREAFCAYAAREIDAEMLRPEIRMDAEACLAEITEALVRDLNRLGPFGTANPRPLLCCRGLELVGTPRRVGSGGEHLQLTVRQGDSTMRCIAFNQAALADRLSAGARIDLAAEPGINQYNGYRSVQLEVKDVRFA